MTRLPSPEMDDDQAQFLIAVTELCLAAELADLDVEVLLSGGSRVRGVPSMLRRADGHDQVDDTGYGRTFRVDDSLVRIRDILQCDIHSPLAH